MNEKLEKVIIENDEDIERMWAEKISNNVYRLDNSPFYVYGCSLNDIVRVEKMKNGELKVIKVLKKGGYTTYRILLKNINFEEFIEKKWMFFEKRKCSFEGANSKLLSISIPIESDLREIYDFLADGEKKGDWSFEESNIEHKKVDIKK